MSILEPESPPRPPSERELLAALAVCVGAPVAAIVPGFADGSLAFVLYREPKLAAITLLGWSFLALWTAVHARRLDLELAGDVLTRPAVVGLTLFGAWMTTTLVWTEVPENHLYELRQLVLSTLLLGVVAVGSARLPSVRTVVEGTLIAALAGATALGFAQLVRPIPWLPPIDPHLGVAHPSLLGYKNPMALAVLGQVFLLGRRVAERDGGARPPVRAALAVLLAGELVYLATLRSRAAYVALAVALLAWVVLRFSRSRSLRTLLRASALASGAAAILAVVGLVSPPVAERLGETLEPLSSPGRYLASDRGVYLLNTLDMVRAHPLGVGLGDWQTHAPRFERHRRELPFPEGFQARRAHSDWIQLLGEGGWPGLALWAVAFLLLVARPARDFLRTGRSQGLYLAVQLVALGIAMAGDYVLEHPFLKLEFFLVAALAVSFGGPRRRSPGRAPRRLGRAAAAAVTAAMLAAATAHGLHAIGSARKAWLGAAIGWHYQAAVGGVDDFGRPRSRGFDRGHLETIAELGGLLRRGPGHTKTLFRDHLLVARAEWLLGREIRARESLELALGLHPNDPVARRLEQHLRPPDGE